MRRLFSLHRLPVALGLSASLASLGCSSSPSRRPASVPQPEPYRASAGGASPDSLVKGDVRTESIRTTSSLPGVVRTSGTFSAGVRVAGSGGAAAPPAEGQAVATNQDMLKVEARVTLEVDRVGDAVVKVRKLVGERGGQIVSDVYSNAKYERGAALTIRIASGDTTPFLTALGELGRVVNQRISGEDVSREFHDQTIVLRNLELTMARYEELLRQAKDVKDMLAIENELTRLRTEMDRVKGNLTFLRDRVARSIVYVTIQPKESSQDVPGPDTDFFPGPKAAYLYDFSTKTDGVGGGIWLRGREPVGVEALVLSHEKGQSKSLLIATVGGDIYSSSFGRGRNRYGNLFLGIRMGVSYTKGRTEAIVPIGLGIELLRTEKVSIAIDVRSTTSFASKRGLAFGVMPTAGFNVAF